MKKLLALTLILSNIPLRAELQEVIINVLGMTCSVCATTLTRQLKELKGVQELGAIDFKTGTATLKFVPENTLSLEQLNDKLDDLVEKAGFTYQGYAKIVARGTIGTDDHGTYISVSHTKDKIYLIDAPQQILATAKKALDNHKDVIISTAIHQHKNDKNGDWHISQPNEVTLTVIA